MFSESGSSSRACLISAFASSKRVERAQGSLKEALKELINAFKEVVPPANRAAVGGNALLNGDCPNTENPKPSNNTSATFRSDRILPGTDSGYKLALSKLPGIRSYLLTTPHNNKVKLNLPYDLYGCEPVSATLEVDTSPNDEAAREELKDHSLKIEGQRFPLKNSIIYVTPTITPDDSTEDIFFFNKNKTVGGAEIPILDLPLIPETYSIPTVGQMGRMLHFRGPFDGIISPNDYVSINDQKIPILAESVGSLIVRDTNESPGLTRIEFSEQGQVTKGEFRNLGISLSAPKLNLLRGETTTLTVRVTGLEGIKEPAFLELENQSPGVISMGLIVEQISISPSQVQPGGVYVITRTLTGIQAGTFGITGTVTVK